MKTYNVELPTNNNENVKLIRAIYNIETSQLNYIRKSINSNGIPSDLNDKLQAVVNIYAKVTSQLDRTIKTNQLDRIVV